MRNIVPKLLVVAAIAAVGAFGADSSVGTWKYNAAKSKSTSSKPIANRTEVREATPDGGVKVTRTGQYADGTPINASYTCKYDGKECSVKGGLGNIISLKRIDANSWSFETRNTANKYHLTGRGVISADGKTWTQTASGTDAEGRSYSHTLIFDKQ